MRFYGKLLAAIGLFALAAGVTPPRALGDLAFDARAAYVMRFGSPGDLDALIEETRRARVEQWIAAFGGYDAGGVYQRLLDERTEAEARRLGRPLTDDDFVRLRAECARDALGDPAARRDGPAGGVSSAIPARRPPVEPTALKPWPKIAGCS